jgi:hypothetical protein
MPFKRNINITCWKNKAYNRLEDDNVPARFCTDFGPIMFCAVFVSTLDFIAEVVSVYSFFIREGIKEFDLFPCLNVSFYRDLNGNLSFPKRRLLRSQSASLYKTSHISSIDPRTLSILIDLESTHFTKPDLILFSVNRARASSGAQPQHYPYIVVGSHGSQTRDPKRRIKVPFLASYTLSSLVNFTTSYAPSFYRLYPPLLQYMA